MSYIHPTTRAWTTPGSPNYNPGVHNPPGPPAQSGYGALAHSQSERLFGWSYGCVSSDRAIERAIRECGSSDARWLLWQSCGYIAVAENADGGYGYASDANRGRAVQAALEQCRAVGPNQCRITILINTRTGQMAL